MGCCRSMFAESGDMDIITPIIILIRITAISITTIRTAGGIITTVIIINE